MANSIESGTTLAHYRILGPLGVGGMGEVYRAHDTTLERTIALKILPPTLVRNEERLRRFIQEARSASSLNHPHIVTIHEIGQTTIPLPDDIDGAATQTIHYIAMELVDGVTLKKKIHAEHADLRVTLGYLAQAADGLAKAHAAGIVHRDLKPENIMVSGDGFAKVLDFGLAKLSARMGQAPASNAESTAVWNETREGSILGTVAYMSPEQVQGRTVDHRSDIFSFGAILYEAATQQRPFDADSDIDVMHRILHDKPIPVDELNPTVPSELRRVIRRCLAKDPDKRYQSMKDLAIELRELVDEYDELSAAASSRSSVSTTSPALAVEGGSRKAVWIALVAASLITVGAIGFGVYSLRQNAAAPGTAAATAPFASMEIRRLTATGTAEDAAISPDGRYVVYVNRESGGLYSLYVRQVATASDVRILDPGSLIRAVSFSPDGNYVYFIQAEIRDIGPSYSWLYQIPALGGTPRKVIWDVDTAVSFAPDGKQFVFGRGVPQTEQNAVVIASVDGTSERVLASFPRFMTPAAPKWSPDGKSIATALYKPPLGYYAKPIIIDITTGKHRELGDVGWWRVQDLVWVPDGSAVLMTCLRDGTGRLQIWRQPLSGEPATRVTNDFNEYDELSLTADGKTLAAAHARYNTELRIGTLPDLDDVRVLGGTSGGRFGEIDVSRAGPIVLEVANDTTSDVAIMDEPDGSIRKLTHDQKSYLPSITADGKTIVFVGDRPDAPHIFVIQSDGSGLRQLTKGSGEIFPVISPDGSIVVYQAEDYIWQVPAAGGTPQKIRERPIFRFEISPDSRYLAFQYWLTTPEGVSSRLRAEPLAGGEPLLDVPAPTSPFLRWTPSGDGITYLTETDGSDVIVVQPVNGGAVIPLARPGVQRIDSYDWRGSDELLMITADGKSDIVLITNF